MRVWLGKEIQNKLVADGMGISMVKGTAEAISEPFFKQIAQEVANSQWIAIAMDSIAGSRHGSGLQ